MVTCTCKEWGAGLARAVAGSLQAEHAPGQLWRAAVLLGTACRGRRQGSPCSEQTLTLGEALVV